jgi:hypothetical protein
MNKHILLAILLISIFFIFTTCGAKEMFSPDPENDVVADVPVSSDPVVTEAMSPTMNSDFNVDLSVGQPTAPPMPSMPVEMGYYNFAKVMYM